MTCNHSNLRVSQEPDAMTKLTVHVVRCNDCKMVLGAIPYLSGLHEKLDEINRELRELKITVSNISGNLP